MAAHVNTTQDSEKAAVITDEQAWQYFSPFLTVGLVKAHELHALLKAPLRQRGERLQLLFDETIQKREAMRRICAECGRREGDKGVDKLMVCGKCANIWYCSRDCQLANFHSGEHKKACTSLKIARICRENQMKRAEMKEDWIRTYLMGLEGHTKMQWPEGQIPEGWSEFFAARQLGHQVSANSNSGMSLSELLHEGLTVALAAKRFGLLGGRGGREGHGRDHGRHRRPFRLHILGATETQEIRHLPLSMGELGALLCPFYFEGKLLPFPSVAGRIDHRPGASRLTVVSPSFLPSLLLRPQRLGSVGLWAPGHDPDGVPGIHGGGQGDSQGHHGVEEQPPVSRLGPISRGKQRGATGPGGCVEQRTAHWRRSSPRGRLHVVTHPYLPGRVRAPLSAYHVRRGGRQEDPRDAGVVRRVRCLGPRLEPHAVPGLGGNGGTGPATVRPPGRGWAHGRRCRRTGRSIATLGIDVV